MALKFVGQRVGFGFFPNSASYQEEMSVIPQRKDLIISITMSRNPAQRRFFHAMLKRMVDAGYADTPEQLRQWFLYAAGHTKTWVTPEGEVFIIPKSLSEEKMQPAEFSRFLDACKKAAAERLSCNIDELMTRTFEDAGPWWEREGR